MRTSARLRPKRVLGALPDAIHKVTGGSTDILRNCLMSVMEANSLLTPEEARRSLVISDPALPDMPIIFVSSEFVEQTGYRRDEVVGRNCRFLQGDGTDPASVQGIREAVDAKRGITQDILNYRRDGSPFRNRLVIRPIHAAARDAMFFVGFQHVIDSAEVNPTPSLWGRIVPPPLRRTAARMPANRRWARADSDRQVLRPNVDGVDGILYAQEEWRGVGVRRR